RLNSNQAKVWVLSLQVATSAGHGAAGAYTGDECINLMAGVFPNLGAGGLVVNLGICLVGELASQNCVVLLLQNLIGLVDGSLHASCTRGQDDLGTICAKQDAALSGHGFRHGQHNLVATSCTYECESNTGVTGGGLHDGTARLELAGFLCCVNDRLTDAVLD